MSEEEIIKQIEIYINLLVEERKNGVANIEQIRFQETIQALLDLYKQEKESNKEFEMLFNEANAREYRKRYLKERRKEQPNLLYPDFDEIYERYYKLKEEIAKEKEKNKELEKRLKEIELQILEDENY